MKKNTAISIIIGIIILGIIVIIGLYFVMNKSSQPSTHLSTQTGTPTTNETSSTTTNTNTLYTNTTYGFSLRYPSQYVVDEKYSYQALGPGKSIDGVKFTIPSTLAQGTNLSNDSYISIEELPKATSCTETQFLGSGLVGKGSTTVIDGGSTYSVASSTDAAAGNRYFETVYALMGSHPCIAIRYFIHYGVYENYPAGSIKPFDQTSLLNQFDSIRRTLILSR